MVFYDTWPKIDPKILLWLLLAVLVVDHIWEMILAKRQVRWMKYSYMCTLIHFTAFFNILYINCLEYCSGIYNL